VCIEESFLGDKSMPGKLSKFLVFGAFKKKSDAVAREKKVHGFIEKKKIRGRGTRYLVLRER